MEQRNSKWNVTLFANRQILEEYSIYSISEIGITGKAGISRIVVIDLDGL